MKETAWVDWYEPGNAWYWVTQIFIYVFSAGLVADLVQVMNLSVTVDTFFRELPGGEYYSIKFSSIQWALLMLTNVKYMMPPLLVFGLLFRKRRSCTILWFVLIVMVWAVSVFVVIGFGRMYSEANGPGQRDNLFSHPLYCCAPDVFNETANNCPNTSPCTCPSPPEPCPDIPTSVRELDAREDAKARFWVDFVYMLYHSLCVVFFLLMIFPLRGVKTTKKE